MIDIDERRLKASISLYTKAFLTMYDFWVLGYNCTFLWKCPSRNLLEMYNRYISNNHLDIGVGTGYFMDKCVYSAPRPDIALMDLSENSLAVALKRLERYHPRVYIGNALEKFNVNGRKFDSIAMMNLLHCLPGDMNTKTIVLDNAAEVLNAGGVLFGSTILYYGVRHNLMSTLMLKWSNRKGIMTNLDDDIDVLRRGLEKRFKEWSVSIIGCMALFLAKK